MDLTNGEKAVVLVENQKNYMQPVILRLKDNNVYDLSDPVVNRRIQIVDLMKTMDYRIEVDVNTLKQFKADKRIIEITQRYKEQKLKSNKNNKL